jgi:hypothetical protein
MIDIKFFREIDKFVKLLQSDIEYIQSMTEEEKRHYS